MAKFQKKPRGNISGKGEEYRQSHGLSKDEVRGLTDDDVSDLEIIEDNTDEVIRRIDIALARALEAVGIEAEGDAKELCPVDTGRLRNSITHTIDERAAYIGTNVEYAPYVHNGIHGRSGQPFLTDAVSQNNDKYKRIFRAMFEQG